MHVVVIDLILVVDGCVACLNKIAGAEKRVCNQEWNNGDTVGELVFIVKQLVDGGC